MEKFCPKCNTLKSIDLFCKCKRSKDGYGYRCKACHYKSTADCKKANRDLYKQKEKHYRETNKEKIKMSKRDHYIRNVDKIRESNNKWNSANKDRISEWGAKRYSENKELLKQKRREYYYKNLDKVKAYQKKYKQDNKEKIRDRAKRLSCNPKNKIERTLRTRILRALKKDGYKKSDLTMKLIGCTIHTFIQHIESQFTKGMTWDNHGNSGWHIDHIIPCKSFNLLDSEQQRLCFNYMNQRPLWATTKIAMKHGEDESYVGNLEKGWRD